MTDRLFATFLIVTSLCLSFAAARSDHNYGAAQVMAIAATAVAVLSLKGHG